MRKQTFYIALIAIALFLTGVFNDQLVKLFFNTSGLLGLLYVITLLFSLCVYKLKDRNDYLRTRNNELMNINSELEREKYNLLDRLTNLKTKKKK